MTNKSVRDNQVELTDPRALRALAHPMRLKLITLLRTVGPLTATRAAERTGESAGTCSFHFRQLAKWGLVEETGAGKGRERPWRATTAITTWSALGSDPEGVVAAQFLSRVLAEHYFRELLNWHERKASEPEEWKNASQTGDVILRLNSDELQQLNRDLRSVLEQWNQTTASRSPSESMRFVQYVGWTYPMVGSPVDSPEEP